MNTLISIHIIHATYIHSKFSTYPFTTTYNTKIPAYNTAQMSGSPVRDRDLQHIKIPVYKTAQKSGSPVRDRDLQHIKIPAYMTS